MESGCGDRHTVETNNSLKSFASTTVLTCENTSDKTSTAGGVATVVTTCLTTDTKESLENQVQQLISDINSKRKEDTRLLSNFRDEITEQIQLTLESVESSVFDLYDHQTTIIDAKINELFAIFDRISKIEKELEEFRSELRMLYREIQDV